MPEPSTPPAARLVRDRETASTAVRGAARRLLVVGPVEWWYRGALLAMFGVAVLLRLPAMAQDLPPFQFCDEQMFSSEVARMLGAHTEVTQEFRSGGFNIYPILWIAQLWHVSPLDIYGITQLGRWVYPVALASAAVFPVASAARLLGGSRRFGIVAGAIVLLSPTLLAVSRYWYPDHYIVFFAALLVRVLVGMALGAPSRRRTVLRLVALGLVWGLALSVKYTFLIAGLPIVIVLAAVALRNGSVPRRLGRLVVWGLGVLAVAALAFLALDPSALVDPNGLRGGFQYNVDHYAQPGASPSGIGFYAFLLVLLAFGPLFLPLAIVGGRWMWRRSPWLTIALGCFPVINILYLGLQGVVYNRNIVASLAFVIPFLAVGVVVSFEWARSRARWRIVVPAGLALFGALQVAQIGFDTVQDMQPDSQPVAAQWIATTLPRDIAPGTNAVCSVSPAHIAGLQTVDDPAVKQHLEYYVLTSYWDSPVVSPWRGRNALPAVFNQKYLQYYFTSDRALPADFFTFPWPSADPASGVPQGYHLIKRFSSNGPEVLVLQRDR